MRNIFLKTAGRDIHGRFVVSIPFKTNPDCLGDSSKLDKQRFYKLDKRFNGNPTLKKAIAIVC